MPFQHIDVRPGNPVRSAEWNAIGAEVVRLGTDKISRVGAESLEGPLTVAGKLTTGPGGDGVGLAVRGDLAVGANNAGAAVRVLRRQEDGRDLTHGALVLGTDAASSASLRIGYAGTYSWLQGQGEQIIAINPHGGPVGIGTATPRSRLAVGGGATVGVDYAASLAPANGLIVQGRVGVGVTAPVASLQVDGNVVLGKTLGQRFVVWQSPDARYLQIMMDDANGNWQWAKGISLVRDTSSVGIGTSAPAARLHVAGGDLRLDAGRTLMIGDNASFAADAGGNLTVTSPVVTLGCYDLKMGHVTRRGTPGRALVDNKDTLVLNWDGDWSQGVVVTKRLQTPSGRAVVQVDDRQETRTSNDWSDLPGMNLFVTTTGNKVLVMFKAGGVQGSGVAAVQAKFRLLVNGLPKAYTLQEFHNGGWELRDVTLTWVGDLGAGDHTVKVQWSTPTPGGILTCSWYNDSRILTAIEL